MRGHAHGDASLIKDLVMMRVEQEGPHSASPVVPRIHALKGVVEGDCDVGGFQVSPAVHVELPDDIHVETWAKWLVDKLDCGHSIVGSMVIADFVQHAYGLSDCVALGPIDGAITTGVIKAVLRSRCY